MNSITVSFFKLFLFVPFVQWLIIYVRNVYAHERNFLVKFSLLINLRIKHLIRLYVALNTLINNMRAYVHTCICRACTWNMSERKKRSKHEEFSRHMFYN